VEIFIFAFTSNTCWAINIKETMFEYNTNRRIEKKKQGKQGNEYERKEYERTEGELAKEDRK
jgi:hypothetical protein